MLYKYNGKIYIRPFINKLVEVKVTKKGDDYDVEVMERVVEITKDIEKNLSSISLEEAYNMKPIVKSTKSSSGKASDIKILDL